ncbi:MAG: pitrilysin family protein [Pseudomonadota bacterium]
MRSKLTGLLVGLLAFAAVAQAEVSVQTTRIGHGVKAWYAENDTVPVVDMVLSFEGAGNASDPEGKGGRAAFAAAMLTEGAGTLDSVAFQRALDEKAITLEVEADDDRLRIHIYCLREHAKRAGELLALALSKPMLEKADQARVQSQMVSLLSQLEEQPNYQVARLLNSRGFKGHPYANAPFGDAASVAALNAQDVHDYLRTYVTRGNVLVAAAGDVDASLLDDVLGDAIEALAENDSGAVAVTPTTLQGGGETLHKTMAVPQTVIAFAAPGIARDDPRFYAAYLLNHILGGNSLFSRLGDDVRQQKGLVYSIDTDLDIKRGAALLSGGLATRNASADAAVAAVKNVLTQMHDKGVTTDECTDAKSYVRGAFARQLDSSSSVSNMLLMMQVHRLGEDYLSERDALFSKVSCGDINAVADALLSPSRFLFAIVGGAPEVGGSGPIAPAPAMHSGDVR